ncbi:hypothetical protein GOBAR_AA21410 [Gossypium barbadense]|uniref:Uncharacterized protein n=1 Tax=Gossypium barbadense TaxID=3634 RepID=A0A2P5X7E1_GOSBA|nr:hypothetical protein GOBAR_AA21410 [Gossypium barbadense]
MREKTTVQEAVGRIGSFEDEGRKRRKQGKDEEWLIGAEGAEPNPEIGFPVIVLARNREENTLIQDGKEMASVLYTYRSCVKALPQGVCWNTQFEIQKLSAETEAASIYSGFWF